MGRWGAGLYDDDVAADLKQSIAIVATIPVSGDRLLEILLRQAERTRESTDDDGGTFWLVIADQFERRGIRCSVVVERALTVLDGLDLGRKRKAGLDKLAKRLRSPRPERTVPTNPKRPDAVVRVGEVYAFPTMAGRSFATHVTSVDPSRLPALPELMGGELLYHSQTRGATRCIPRRSELKYVPFQLVGTCALDPRAAQSVVAGWPSVEQAVQLGWSMRDVAFGRDNRVSLPKGPPLSTLVSRVESAGARGGGRGSCR